MAETTRLLSAVKTAGQDFEWYPTTRSMLEVVAADIVQEIDAQRDDGRTFSILDIGAGNGSALATICELAKNDGPKYAIEKSKILIDSLPADFFVIGTNFHEQTLIDKRVDVVFCNPPYSEFKEWMRRIVAEANCRILYMVVPERWREDKAISATIEKRCGLAETYDFEEDDDPELRREIARSRGLCSVLGSDSFEDSEYRKARAKVDILKIKFRSGYRDELELDPFDLWFEEHFKIRADAAKDVEDGPEPAARLHELVQGQNLIERLEELYRKDFDALLDTYRQLERLDHALFKELGVDLPRVRGGLKQKIAGLKNLYWSELFNNLDAITSRLTSSSRKRLLEKLTAHTSVDFTAANAYAIVVWAIKNANQYFDSQLLEVYQSLADRENIRNYKSNHRLVEDGWRYQRSEATHYTLDYRLVLERHYCFGGYSWDCPNGLNRGVHDLLNDLCTIAKNLGFGVLTNSMDFQWGPGGLNEFLLDDGSLLMDVRAYKKGTVHIRCNQDFMRRLNVESGRLNGWIKSPAEAEAELEISDADAIWETNYRLKSLPMLAAPCDDTNTEQLALTF